MTKKSPSLNAALKRSEPEVHKYVTALELENLKCANKVARLEAKNVAANNRIAALEHEIKKRDSVDKNLMSKIANALHG